MSEPTSFEQTVQSNAPALEAAGREIAAQGAAITAAFADAESGDFAGSLEALNRSLAAAEIRLGELCDEFKDLVAQMQEADDEQSSRAQSGELKEFLIVVRRALLLMSRWIEKRYCL